MMCDRYWREGILLVERGLPDPHREGCADCQHAHASREELIEALPLIGEGYTGDPRWQSNVWERIEGKRARARWHWLLEGVLAAACALLIWLGVGLRVGPDRPQEENAQDSLVPHDGLALVEVVPRTDAMRSKPGNVNDRLRTARVDDRLRISARLTSEIWVYHAGKMILRCGPHVSADRCTTDAQRRRVEIQLSRLGGYEVFVFEEAVGPTTGRLYEDRAVLDRAGIRFLNERIMVQ
jgi:hypothetical protein